MADECFRWRARRHSKRKHCNKELKLTPPSLGGLFFPAASLCATQYEIPFKLSIITFQISIMAITPAMASHKDRHPSW
jgi:hypothetical protein